MFYLALVYLPTWINETAHVPLRTSMKINTLTLALLIPFIPLAGWISDRYIRRTRFLTAVLFVLGIAGVFILKSMRDRSLTIIITGQIVLGLLLAVPMGVAPALFTEDDRLTGYSIVFNVGLGVVGGLTPLTASWLILQTGYDLAPSGLLVAAVAIGIVALLWMRDDSREPLRTTCRISISDAVRAVGEVCAGRCRR